MDPIIIVIGIITLVVLKLCLSNNERRKLINKIPGPREYPIIGNFLDIRVPTSDVIPMAIKRMKKYGPIMRLWFGPTPFVSVSSPEYVEIILSSNKELHKSCIYRLVESWLGKGLLTSYGPRWFKHRKLITPTFHFNILDSFVSVFESNSAVLVSKLQEKAKSGETFDLYPFITHCALDIICETAMGIHMKAQGKEDSMQHEYVTSIYKVAKLTAARTQRFYLMSDVIYNLTSDGREYRKSLEVIHGFTRGVIRERKALRQGCDSQARDSSDFGRKKRKAFLDLLLDSAADLSDQDLQEEVDTFMFAGHDTTTAGLSWAFFLLGHHQEIQDEVAEEVRSIWPEGEDLTLQMLNEMKLLERVLKESLRIFPSVPFISRELIDDLKIGEYLLPAKTVVSVPILALHRNENVFPDPLKFDPDRFLPENIQKRHPYSYVPFSAGPRNCIGQKFALLEEKAMAASVLRTLKITSMMKLEEVVELAEIITRPKDGIMVTLTRRE